MSSFPDGMLESIGPVRWRLQVPHLGLADFRHLQKLGLRQYTRRPPLVTIAVCAAIGVAIGPLITLAASYWDVWIDGSVALGSGRRTLLIFEDDRFSWAMTALVIAIVAATWLFFVANYRVIVRRIFNTSRRDMPYWSLEVGEDGLQMSWNKVTMTVPWSDVRSLRSNKAATFLTFDAYYKAVGISHAAFATDADRDAWLDFMTAKIGPKSSLVGTPRETN
jgi:hypothetical protein